MQSLREIELRAPAVGAKIGVFFCMSRLFCLCVGDIVQTIMHRFGRCFRRLLRDQMYFAILNFRNSVFWSCILCWNVILLYRTKFRVNRTYIRRDIAKRRFSIWRPSAILNLKNFGILLSSRPWKHNLYQRTKFR